MDSIRPTRQAPVIWAIYANKVIGRAHFVEKVGVDHFDGLAGVVRPQAKAAPTVFAQTEIHHDKISDRGLFSTLAKTTNPPAAGCPFWKTVASSRRKSARRSVFQLMRIGQVAAHDLFVRTDARNLDRAITELEPGSVYRNRLTTKYISTSANPARNIPAGIDKSLVRIQQGTGIAFVP